MSRIVYVYNHGCDDYVDSCGGREVVLVAGECSPMDYHEAVFFAGDGTVEDRARVTSRRGGVAPTLSIHETMPNLETLKASASVEKNANGAVAPNKGKGIVANIPSDMEADVVAGGKYKGENWDAVLNDPNFDKTYWKVAMNVVRDIPQGRKEQLLEKIRNS